MADEERFDRLEAQIGEMLGLMSKLMEQQTNFAKDFNQHRREFADVVSVVISTERKVESLDQKVERLDQKVESLDQKVERLDQRVESLDQKVESLDQKLGDFQVETRTNFERIFRENIITNRRVDILTPTVSEMQARVQELENRMEKVEHKIAA